MTGTKREHRLLLRVEGSEDGEQNHIAIIS
jgi:hypothetical protein